MLIKILALGHQKIMDSRDKTEKVEHSPDGKVIKFPPCNNTNLSEGNV